ncbi:MAG: glycerol-3-phosphate dehydrogenase [Pseudomonadota bacterium]
MAEPKHDTDLLVIGGGINGVAIARDAAGRGLRVHLVEMDDLAQSTTSPSTNQYHGGLRYREYYEVRLVRESLIERETLLKAMPHISWPMRFVLPFHPDMRFDTETPTSRLMSRVMPWMKGRRPAWLIRLGLFLYDSLGGREILPGTRTLDLRTSPEGAPLKSKFAHAYEYSDAWVEDSRLVVLTARDAQSRGAVIETRAKVISADRLADGWTVHVENRAKGEMQTLTAKALVNAGGPWVGDVIHGALRLNSSENVRLVQGSHIVTRRLFDHEKCYFFQGTDGRIIFAIPYETDYTLIGTTDRDYEGDPSDVTCSDAEKDYLCNFASQYFERPVTRDDVVWSFSGVRPLYDDGATSATAATRDYVLSLDTAGAPVLNVFGGKITTHRRLAEHAVDKLKEVFPEITAPWTAGVSLPGGDFQVAEKPALIAKLRADYPFLEDAEAIRLIKAYGTEAPDVLGEATERSDLGRVFGATLAEREVLWLMDREYAQTAADVVWRRSKLGLRMTAEEIEALDSFMAARRAPQPEEAA